MELRFNGCSHLHYIQAIRAGKVVKVSNIGHGRPALKFKKVSDLYESEDVKNVRSMVILLPKEELSVPESRGGGDGRSALESDQSSSGFSVCDVKDEIDERIDDASLDGMTIGQMREIFKSKKRKRRNHLDVTEINGVIVTVKKEVEDEDELLEPLIIWKTKVKDGFIGKRRCVKKNTKTPSDAEVVPSAQIHDPEPAPKSPRNYNSSIVVQIGDEPHGYPADASWTVGDSDVVCIDAMVPDSTEYIKQGVDCHSNKNPFIVYTIQETAHNEAREEAIACNLDSEVYTCKEAESCVVNEVLHEKIGHVVFWDDKDAGFAAVDHVANEEASTSSLVILGGPTKSTQTDLPMDTSKSCDEDSVTGDLKMSLKGSDLSSEMTSSATLQPNVAVSRGRVIQYADKIRESLPLNHETVAVTAPHGGSSSRKMEQDIPNNEVQFEDNCSATLYSSHETSFMGVWGERSSSGEHLPDKPVFPDGEVRYKDGSRGDLHSIHEISDTCVSSESSPSQELQSKKKKFHNTESLIVDGNRERLQSSCQTSDTGIFRETPSLRESSEQDRQDYEPKFEGSSRDNLQSSHKACPTGSPVPPSNLAENSIEPASSGFCSSPYDSAVDIVDELSHVKACEDAEMNNSADAPGSAVVDAITSTELGNDDHDRRLQRSSGRLFCTRKVISPKSQERLHKLLGSAELCDDENYPRRKLIFQKPMETKNSGVPSKKVKRAELPSSPNQFRRKQKNHVKGLLPQGVCNAPPFSVGTPSVNSKQSSAESAIAFSQRQMQDIDSLASKLMNELNAMKDIIEENICSGNNLAGAKTYSPDEMREAIDNASKVKETARKWLSIMARDCNRFCKIMRVTEGRTISEKGVNKERKKIVFADEAGGKLCQVKYIEEDMSSTLEVNMKDEEDE